MNFKTSVPFFYNENSFIGDIIDDVINKALFIASVDNTYLIKRRKFLAKNVPQAKSCKFLPIKPYTSVDLSRFYLV